jgi:hypothetical protein
VAVTLKRILSCWTRSAQMGGERAVNPLPPPPTPTSPAQSKRDRRLIGDWEGQGQEAKKWGSGEGRREEKGAWPLGLAEAV